MNKAYKFRLYPNNEQKRAFSKTFGCVRFIYNQMLEDKKNHYDQTGEKLRTTPATYKKEHEWLKEVDSLALANAQLQLETAYKNFFRDKAIGFPKFRSKKTGKQSYTTNNQKGSVRIEGNHIKLPKIGWVKVKQHRKIPVDHLIKSVTVTQKASGKYFVSVLVEYEATVPVIEDPDHVVGLDFSIPELYVSANNIDANVVHYYKLSLQKLAKAQRKLSKCVRGSQNYEKQRKTVARIHEHIANQRYDYLHKKTTQIANAYDCLCIEDVSIPEMVQALPYHPVHQTIYDDAWGIFTRLLTYKMRDRGKHLLKADKSFPSSQCCHVCGYLYSELKLTERNWTCPGCQTYHNRDKNAAFNLKAEGKRLLQLELQPV